MSDLLALFPLDLVLFPETPLPLHIFEPRYKDMVGECLRERRPFGMLRSNGQKIAQNGCTAEIVDVLRTYPDRRMDILTMGRERFHVLEVNDERSFLRGRVEWFDDDLSADGGKVLVAEELKQSTLEMHAELEKLVSLDALRFDADSSFLSFQLAAHLPVDLDFKQTLLEMRAERERLQVLLDYYAKIIPKLQSLSFGKQKAGGNGWIN
ncbi:MAG TPA: LON peptidase substrate-binding domain-containing protein [Terriglobales bacterium]|nr:LON peptidase substrate-binding domain-containing protein [Terriglobales bacterium]